MTDSLLTRARRASQRSPRYIAGRLREIAADRLRRPWSNIYPHLLTPGVVVRAAGAASVDDLWQRLQLVPFFFASSDRDLWVRDFDARFPEKRAEILAAADRVLRHEFDLLGSGGVLLGSALPWHVDFKSGREWPIEYAGSVDYSELDKPSDVKVPWELSRSQHFTVLGQAYWLTGDERFAAEFAAEITDWIPRNPWAYGVNWACPMDVALRAVSWIWGFHFMNGAQACASAEFRDGFVRALYLHGDYVATHIERADVNGNHYLSDAVGLVFLGTFFRSTVKGQRWLKTGREMIEAEIFNQTSGDGVDFEKSTAYHRLVLEAFLSCGVLMARQGEPFTDAWQERLERMLEFVEAYVKPDGRIPLVGDADDGRIQKLGTQPINEHRYLLSTGAALFGREDFKRAAGRFWDESFWMLGPTGVAAFDATAASPAAPVSAAFPDGGFFVLRSDRAHVFIDCGEVGMHGRGGHGHNDILSFELWLDGINLVTDCGAFLYTASREWRNRFRSTAFHNVVQVGNEEMNRFISENHLWQLRDDARPVNVEWAPGDRVDRFQGGHTGYRRLHPPVDVAREIELIKDEPSVVIRDRIDGAMQRSLTWRFHLDPEVAVEKLEDDLLLSAPGGEAWLQMIAPTATLNVTVESGWVSVSYGVRTPNQVVVVQAPASLPLAAAFRIGVVRASADQLRRLLMRQTRAPRASLVGT
ncbi:MAG TPA: alginate lyase family protein [Vicinamibacterales bacterium]|nr:alginate lyase family protein [Vicinamibacterales bacterium]